MKESTSREKVLKSIRDALVDAMVPSYVDEDYSESIYHKPDSEFPEVSFAEALARVGGQFVYSSDRQEFLSNFKEYLENSQTNCLHCFDNTLQEMLNEGGIFCFNAIDDFKDCQVGVTACEFLVSRLGSIMVSSRQSSGRRGFFWPTVHLVIVWKDQLVGDLKQAFKALRKKYEGHLPSMITLITGPSRTADIEKTLVMGAHGPKQLIVFFIDEDRIIGRDDVGNE